MRFVAQSLGLILLFGGCTTTDIRQVWRHASSEYQGGVSCSVTTPGGEPPLIEPQTLIDDFNYWNAASTLGTILPPDGKVIFSRGRPGFIDTDGNLELKWPWTRVVRGQLAIEGRRLDAPAAPLRYTLPTSYGSWGFQPSTLIFSGEGCWEVTGRVNDESLTFVIWVIREDE
jgi:hypothetical protein